MKNNSLIFVLIGIIIILTIILFSFNMIQKTNPEKYQVGENEKKEKEEKEIQPFFEEELRERIYYHDPQDLSNVAEDALLFGILPNLTFKEIEELYTINRDKKSLIDQFIRRYYGLQGGLGRLGRRVKIEIPRDILTLPDLTTFANESVYNSRLVSLYLQDQFEVNNIPEFQNLVAWRYGGPNPVFSNQINNRREDASGFLMLLLTEIFETLGVKYLKIRQTEEGDYILFADISNLRPQVGSSNSHTLEDLRTLPFIFNTMINGFYTFVRDPNSVEAMSIWNSLQPILDRARQINTRDYGMLTGPVSIKFIDQPTHFSMQHFNLNLPENAPFLRIFFGDFILRELDASEIYGSLRNTSFLN